MFPGSTIVCIGGGPSLTQEDVDACFGWPCIAIKEAIQLAPWASVLYSSDARWFNYAKREHAQAWCLETTVNPAFAAPLQNTGELGLETNATGLRTGRSSGYAAINLAAHLGASRIVLLGYDYKPGPTGQRNWFGDRPASYWRAMPPYDDSIMRCWPSIVQPLEALGIEVVNATPGSALTMFPQMSLAEALV
jgi:hypothetical protein